MKKYLAEMIGTMVLVLMGCGSAVFAGSAAGRLVQVRNAGSSFCFRLVRCGDGIRYRRNLGLSY